MSGSTGRHLGVVIDGSFTAGLTARLAGARLEELQVGSFVVVEGGHHRYFSLVTDLQLRASDPGIMSDPPASSSFHSCRSRRYSVLLQ